MTMSDVVKKIKMNYYICIKGKLYPLPDAYHDSMHRALL